jgi:hypothetical protein
MKKITCSPPNAIIFVYDPTNKNANTPDYIAGKTVSSNEDCISIGTQADVDGDVNIVICADEMPPQNLQCVFRGSLRAPGKKIIVGTAHLETLLELEITKESTDLSVWVDDVHNPASVFILVESMRL